MAELSFQDLFFSEEEGKIKVTFLRIFHFFLEKEALRRIGSFCLKGNRIDFSDVSEKQAGNKLSYVLEEGFKQLKSSVTGRRAAYIHRNSGIPLIGSIYFGIIDRGTNIIEVRPITGCNLSCIYCSVDEGKGSKRVVDYVVEKDYLVQELKKVIEYKKCSEIDIHINSQGEPLLYADLSGLVRDIKAISEVKIISVDTNGTLLTRQLIDELAEAGLSRINLSLNALSTKIASEMAGCPYNVGNVMENARYAATRMDIIIAPLLLKGHNEQEMGRIIEFAREIKAGKNCPPVGIQNFMAYKHGRNPAGEIPMEEFYSFLDDLEREHCISLRVKEGFRIIKTKELSKPFKRREIVSASAMVPGRLKGEMIAAAKGRVIAVQGCHKTGDIKLRITRSKHNIFYGELV